MIKKTKKYTIIYLLNKQPKTLQKLNDFKILLGYYHASEELKNIFFGRKCYSLLNNSKITPGKLEQFYKIYKLPKNPFFPLFLKIKKDFLNNKEKEKKKKDEYILKKMLELPDEVKTFIIYFSKYEKSLNRRKRFPIWAKFIYPQNKKIADSMLKYNKNKWINLFFKYIEHLKERYKTYNDKYANKIIALFILELPIKKHSEEEIKNQYRKLSKKHHPDLGGNSKDFNLLQKAKSIMLD
jgi:hypothetical protein